MTLVNLFDPDATVIGGGVAGADPMFFSTVREVGSDSSLSRHSRQIEIHPATFGQKASVMGAIPLMLDEVLSLRLQTVWQKEEKR